jgi:hypothetical protein
VPGAAPEAASLPEAEAPGDEPAASVLGDLEVLADDLKGTMAGTPGQRIRVLVLVVVLGIVMLLALAALRASGSLDAVGL